MLSSKCRARRADSCSTFRPNSSKSTKSKEPKKKLRHEHCAESHPVFHDFLEGLLGLLELEDFDARAHVRERAEGHRLLGVDGAAAGPARDRLSAEQRERGDLQRRVRRRDDEQLSAWLQAADRGGYGIGVWGGRKKEGGSSEPLQGVGDRGPRSVDVLGR